MLHGPHNPERDRALFRLPFVHFAVGTVLLPLCGMIVCIITSMIIHYEESTATHCGVPNYLPSISSSFGLRPELYLWSFCIGLHSAPRFLLSVTYYNFYRIRFAKIRLERLLSLVALVFSLAENMSLLGLTYVSSNDNHRLHISGFIVFLATSLVHMLLTCRLWYVIRRYSPNPEELSSYRWKLRMFIFTLISCALALYFYRRHNDYCEPGVYTFFALLEYMVVLFNMGFHMTAYWDFRSREVMVATAPEDKQF